MTSDAAAESKPSVDFDAHVNRGSWATFEPSLAEFMGAFLQPRGLGGGVPDELGARSRGGGEYGGAALLLTAPTPIATEESVHTRFGLRSLLRRSPRPVPSPEVPGVVITGRSDGVEVALPILDGEGRVLLDPAACEGLESLGWVRLTDTMVRLIAQPHEAAVLVERILIEILRVPHPADLDWLFQELGEA